MSISNGFLWRFLKWRNYILQFFLIEVNLSDIFIEVNLSNRIFFKDKIRMFKKRLFLTTKNNIFVRNNNTEGNKEEDKKRSSTMWWRIDMVMGWDGYYFSNSWPRFFNMSLYPYPVPDGFKIFIPFISVPVAYRVSPTPTRTRFQFKKINWF